MDLPADFEAIDIDAGQDHTCAVGHDGDVYCWGSNSDGQLGIGTTVSSSSPSMAQLPTGVRALSVSAGSSILASPHSGDVYCWGNGADSQTGESLVAVPNAVFTESWESTPSSEWVSSGTRVGRWIHPLPRMVLHRTRATTMLTIPIPKSRSPC